MEALRYAAANGCVIPKACLDATTLPFNDDAFDAVMCLEVLEHLSDPGQALAELCRVARDFVLVSVPDEPFFSFGNLLRLKNVRLLGRDPDHTNFWSATSFVKFVSRHAEVESVVRAFPWTLVSARPRLRPAVTS